MLELQAITKDYRSGTECVHALRGVSLRFRDNEFVSILGPSGCGKTTLLNIIGGLDRYTAGDLLINGVSTKQYRDRDWDAYRNHTIGFVFQSYNLIPHQSVLANVELALTLSGVSRKERRRRAPLRCWRRSASAISCTRSQTRCPAARCSASPSPAPSSTTRTFCWRTSRPARWTPRRACRSWKFSRRSRATASSSWSRTIRSWPSAIPPASSVCWTAVSWMTRSPARQTNRRPRARPARAGRPCCS